MWLEECYTTARQWKTTGNDFFRELRTGSSRCWPATPRVRRAGGCGITAGAVLGSDHSSAFVVGHGKRRYQLLAIDYYSTTRKLVPLVEIVKLTVKMMQRLATELGLDLVGADVAIHYPNIFPETWKMVTRYLRNPELEHLLDGMAERAHCGSSDSVISLAKSHRGQEGRIHIALNYGVGLHLAVCVLKEKANGRSITGVEAD